MQSSRAVISWVVCRVAAGFEAEECHVLGSSRLPSSVPRLTVSCVQTLSVDASFLFTSNSL